jgi:predicted dehydrogenase
MRYLIGSEPVRLYGETERRIHTEHEDLFNGIMKFANGVIGVLDINWLTPTKKRTLTVTGERGMYVVDYITQDLVFYANPDVSDHGAAPASVSEGEITRRIIQRREPLAVELEEFARAVRDGGPPPVHPRDAMIALLLARKMVESASTGQVVAGPALQAALS